MTVGSFSLVLSGGGLKGLAHIGVFRALAERGLQPDLVVGSSMGSLVGAAWAAGMPVAEMERRGLAVQRRDIFQVARVEVAFRRLLAPALYRREPLDALIAALVGDRTFQQLQHRLLVNTSDLNSGAQVLWGMPGLDDISVADAVFASCALPGIFPPRAIRGRAFVDGAVVENLPIRAAAALGRGPVIAVNVSASNLPRAEVEKQGFAATYARGLEMVMQTQIEGALRGWRGPPLVLVQPRVEEIPMFAFDRTHDLIEAGYAAMRDVLDAVGPIDRLERRVYPQRRVLLTVDRERCVGCGACAVAAPGVFTLDHSGRPEVLTPVQVWSPFDGGYVMHCPTRAITAAEVDAAPDVSAA